MNLSVVLSIHVASFKAVAFKGDFEINVKRIASYGYDGVEPAIRDPNLVDHNSDYQGGTRTDSGYVSGKFMPNPGVNISANRR